MSVSAQTDQPYQPPAKGFRTFILLWLTQSLSMIGTNLTFFSITILLTQVLYPAPEQKTDLAFALSAISLGFGIPNVLVAPIAGAWADRYDRKTIMIVMDFTGALLSQVLLLMIVSGVVHTWLLVIVVALFSINGAFHSAAFDSSYAMLVTEKQLPRANGMMQTIFSLSGILSPAIAAGMIALPDLARQGVLPAFMTPDLAALTNGVPLAIGLDVFTFLLAAAVPLFLFVPSPKRSLTDRPKTMWADVKEGIFFIWRRRPIVWLLSAFTVANLVIAFTLVQRPLMVKFNLAADWTARGFTFETALALLSSVAGIGGVIGGVLISAWGGLRTRRVFGVLIPMIFTGFAQVVYGLSPWLFLTAGAAALWSAMIPILNAHSQSIWQSVTPRELQGRVFAARRVIAQFTIPLGTLLGGSAGGFFDPGLSMAVAGVLMILFTIGQLFNPSLLRIEDKKYLEHLADGEVTRPVAVRRATVSTD